MAKKIVEKEINLLPKEEFETSTLGRTLKWLLTSFRYIVIITEMVVMAAFLSRFYLDARSSELIDGINQKKAVISSYSTFEEQFRSTQNKLAIFSQYAADSEKISPLMSVISTTIPADITLTQLTLDGPQINITGATQNENSISTFLNSLGNSPLFTNNTLPSIESKEGDPTLLFTISTNISERSQDAGQSQ